MPNDRASSWRTAGGEVLELDRNGWRAMVARAPMAGARAGSHPSVIQGQRNKTWADQSNSRPLSESAPRGVPVPKLTYHGAESEAEAALPRCARIVPTSRGRARRDR